MERRQYTAIAKLLHWTMAVVIICAWIAGYYSSTLSLPQKIQADSIMLHKSIATITLFLVAARIPWRLIHGAPEASCGVPSLERAAARFGHLLLYICMLVLPVSGWPWSSAAGFKIPVAGLFFLPPLMDKTRKALGAAAFAEAQLSGRTLSYEETLAEVREWLNCRS